MKAIPNSLRPDPYRPKRVAVDPGPASFRTAVHRVLASTDPKRPPAVETRYRETPLTVPGVLVQATDREYVVTESGSLRRRAIRAVYPRTPGKAEAKARAKSAERIEDAIARADRRRRERIAKRKAGPAK